MSLFSKGTVIVIIIEVLCYSESRHSTEELNELFRGEAQETFYWGDWSEWSECERHCSTSKGRRRRVRVCFRSANTQHLVQRAEICNGKLDGDSEIEESCYDEKCDGTGSFIGTWAPWEPWTCTFSSGMCGQGTNVRLRFCSKVSDSVSLDSRMRVGPGNCPEGEDSEEEECFKRCPAITRADKYGGWSEWSPWTCDRECVPGVMATRDRRCDNPPPLQGYTCPGKTEDRAPCNGTCLKQWGEWLHWSQCTKTCDEALRERRRDCVGYGLPCVGDEVERKRCLDQTRHKLCPPVDGRWSRWTFWSDECSVTCGQGVRVRTRKCNNPPQAGLGRPCEGKSNQTVSCAVDAYCPVDGKWSEWRFDGDCSKECGGGVGHGTRTCTPPSHGGRPCEGESERSDAPCNTDPCPDATLPPELANSIQERLLNSHANLVKENGQGAMMDCTSDISLIHENFPDARIEWKKNGQLLAVDGARVQLDAGRLVMEAVTSGDNGVYTCQVTAGGVANIILAIFSLAVPPEEADTKGYEAEGLEIPCNGAQLGQVFDEFTTQWYKGDRLIKSYEDMQPEEVNVEHFKNIDKRYEGLYKCVVTHTPTQRQWVTNIAQVEVLPKRAIHKRLLGMASSALGNKKTIMMIGGGIGGFVLLIVAGCGVCICFLGGEDDDDDYKSKDKDKNAKKPLLGESDKSKVKPGQGRIPGGVRGPMGDKAGVKGRGPAGPGQKGPAGPGPRVPAGPRPPNSKPSPGSQRPKPPGLSKNSPSKSNPQNSSKARTPSPNKQKGGGPNKQKTSPKKPKDAKKSLNSPKKSTKKSASPKKGSKPQGKSPTKANMKPRKV